MTEALDFAAPSPDSPSSSHPRRSRISSFPTAQSLLSEGGDSRLTLDPVTARNKYGCPSTPDQGSFDFGSSTASIISPAGFAAAQALRDRLAEAAPREAASQTYARELDRIRAELICLNGLDDLAGLDVVFAASGTDLHLLVSSLIGQARSSPLICVGVEAEETGSGVPAALAGRHFSTRAALGEAVSQGAPIGPTEGSLVSLPCRDVDGGLRDGALIEAELDAIVYEAASKRRRVLLTLADVSKTGLISPSLQAVLALRRRFPATVEVLVDACQFRLAPATLRAYLDHGLMVAVTGSKFLTGPTFSGALFVPGEVAERLRGRLLPADLRAYSARAEWPRDWVAGASMAEAANFGLLLRWQAALEEMRRFRAIPETDVRAFMAKFAWAIQTRLHADPVFEPLDVRALDRRAIGAPDSWDLIPTIFPFRLRHSTPDRSGLLSLAAVEDVFRAVLVSGSRVGQPVFCGQRDNRPVSALRLCNSARLTVEAAEVGAEVVIDRALRVLDQVALAARRMSQSGRV